MASFAPSKLGTKEYWDQVYRDDLHNFPEFGEGEIWFGKESVDKMVDWALKHVPPSTDPSIIEIGSGNGVLLFALVEAGYASGKALGIDYCDDAVKLATAVGKSRGLEGVTFAVCDFLQEDLPLLPHMDRLDSWDVIMDKGTFDAISLSARDDAGRSAETKYLSHVARLLKPGAHLLITSCNFIEEELREIFETAETGLVYHSRVAHPTFTFGGKSGSIVATVAFRRTAP